MARATKRDDSMNRDTPIRTPGDRGEDPRACPHLAEKPPVLTRRAIQLISAACLLVIIYGTIGPLKNYNAPWIAMPQTWSLVPPTDATSPNDLLTNFLVYIPVGIALRLLIRRRGRAGAADFLFGLAAAVALSYLTEVAQQFMPSRSANILDFYLNSAGAFLGTLIAPGAQRRLRHLHAQSFRELRIRPWNVARILVALVIAALMTVPWDLTYPEIELEWWRAFDPLDLRRWAMFMLFGFVSTMAIMQFNRRLSYAVERTIEHVFILAVFLEASQAFLISHSCALLDIATAWAGGLLGCLAARQWLRIFGGPEPTDEPLTQRLRYAPGMAPRGAGRSLAIVLLAAAILFAGWMAFDAQPGAIGTNYTGNVLVVPFQSLFSRSFDRVITHVFEVGGLYMLVVGLGLYLTRGLGRRATLILVIALAAAGELLRLGWNGGPADISTLVLAATAWFVAVRVWDAYFAWLHTRQQANVLPARG